MILLWEVSILNNNLFNVAQKGYFSSECVPWTDRYINQSSPVSPGPTCVWKKKKKKNEK